MTFVPATRENLVRFAAEHWIDVSPTSPWPGERVIGMTLAACSSVGIKIDMDEQLSLEGLRRIAVAACVLIAKPVFVAGDPKLIPSLYRPEER
jgi:hypothetical protein